MSANVHAYFSALIVIEIRLMDLNTIPDLVILSSSLQIHPLYCPVQITQDIDIETARCHLLKHWCPASANVANDQAQ